MIYGNLIGDSTSERIVHLSGLMNVLNAFLIFAQLHCYRNGNSGLNFDLRLRKNYKPEEVIQEIQKHLNLTSQYGLQEYRFFNQDGVEINIKELDLLNDNEKLFVSEGKELSKVLLYNVILGEDFDQISMLAEYKIIKQLGQGGFGKVMLATHRQTGKEVAIKIVNAAKFGKITIVS